MATPCKIPSALLTGPITGHAHNSLAKVNAPAFLLHSLHKRVASLVSLHVEIAVHAVVSRL